MEAEKGNFTQFRTRAFRIPQLTGCGMRVAGLRVPHPARLKSMANIAVCA